MEKDLGKIKKNDQTDIVLRIDDFADKRGLTIREFKTSDRYTGFTKAGVKIMAKDFPQFKEMINSVSEEDMKEPEKSEDSSEDTSKEDEKPSEDSSKEDLPDY